MSNYTDNTEEIDDKTWEKMVDKAKKHYSKPLNESSKQPTNTDEGPKTLDELLEESKKPSLETCHKTVKQAEYIMEEYPNCDVAFMTSLLNITGKCKLALRTKNYRDIDNCLRMNEFLNLICKDPHNGCQDALNLDL